MESSLIVKTLKRYPKRNQLVMARWTRFFSFDVVVLGFGKVRGLLQT